MAKMPEGGRGKSQVFASNRTKVEDPAQPAAVEADFGNHKKILSHSFRPPATSQAHGYKGTNPKGSLRVSGHGGAHQVGKR